MIRSRKLLVLVATTALLAGACSSRDTESDSQPSSSVSSGKKAPKITTEAAFSAAGSIGRAFVVDAQDGDELILADDAGIEVARGTADKLGSLIFYDVKPAKGYTVRHVDGSAVAGTEQFTVPSETDVPDASLYTGQTLNEGLNYVTMRDGVELSMTVRLPMGKTLADGPFPTVVEYSGYQIAAPHSLFDSILAGLGGGDAPEDPLVPDEATAVGSAVAPLLGFAAVSVQMRGTGCSGGAFDLFDLPTVYDGYDAVEIAAAQDWVKGNKVGMVGISFSGITQLFVGGTRPPHLAAVAPLSPTDDLYRTIGYPGGIFNTGFAKSWLEERVQDAKPAPEGGQDWAKELVKQGDQHCIDNQKLHGQTLGVFETIADNPFRTPALFDNRSPMKWAADIEVPVFIVGASQDEQIIGLGPRTLAGLEDNPNVWATIMNGTHVDPLGPGTVSRWAEFLNLFVADQIPVLPEAVLALGSQLYDFVADSPAEAIPQSRFADMTDVEVAKAEFKKDPRVRVLMDNGGGDLGPGALQPVWEMDFDTWPPKDVEPTAYYLGADGALSTAKPTGEGEDSYTADPKARPEKTLKAEGDEEAWLPQPPYDWQPVAEGKGLGYTSEALAEDLVITGPSSLDLYLKSSAKDTDVQVAISEVRPDGKENYVQSGWLRASHRALDEGESTELEPLPTHLEQDAKEMPADEFELVRVPIFPVAYAFRAGSKIRITIQAPGGDRPRWKFDSIDEGTTTDTISRSEAMPSKIVLPVLPGQEAGAPLPACGALRGTACRDYQPASNGG